MQPNSCHNQKLQHRQRTLVPHDRVGGIELPPDLGGVGAVAGEVTPLHVCIACVGVIGSVGFNSSDDDGLTDRSVDD